MQPRVILVGGFLGAGKTTLIAEVVRRLTRRGQRVGVVTNDQAANLVDTGLLKTDSPHVGEVAGACFCCSFDSFICELTRLDELLHPDILIGEPVGSCTDLSSTVVQPLKSIYTDLFRTAPYTVLVDPMRLRESFASSPAQLRFPDSVLYIYRLQIEEADAIVLNKSDLLSPEELASLKAELETRYPGRPVSVMSAASGQGVDLWLDFVLGRQPPGQRLATVDYDRYAEGEALLGWLNATARLAASAPTDWKQFCRSLLEQCRTRLNDRSAEIAHAKLLLTAEGGWLAANLTGGTREPAMRGDMTGASPIASLIINVRAHIAPEPLGEIVRASLRTAAGDAIREEVAEIRTLSPGRPNPTHRFREVV